MIEMKSTMGAPLTHDEINRILDTWADLRHHEQPQTVDPVEMLNYISETIILCHAARRAIDNAWYHANNRAFPDEPRRQPLSKSTRGVELARALAMLTEDEIAAVMAKITGTGGAKP